MKPKSTLKQSDKVEVSRLRFTTKDVVRRLKKGEGAQKEYRLLAEFENEVSDEDLRTLEEKLTGAYNKAADATSCFASKGRFNPRKVHI